jgi:hypothetical protein
MRSYLLNERQRMKTIIKELDISIKYPLIEFIINKLLFKYHNN